MTIYSTTIFLDEILKYFGGSMLVFLTYWFGIRGKKADIDNQKTKELNVVLSNMLNTYNYLNKLNNLMKFYEDKSDTLIFPKNYLPIMVLKSGLLDDNCFEELEKSIDTLKQYDPISYFKLDGVGRKFDYIRKNYVLPFLQSTNENTPIQSIARSLLDRLLNDIETHIRETSKLISKNVMKNAEKIIAENSNTSYEEMKLDLNTEYYETYISAITSDYRPTFDEFVIEVKKPENQEGLKKQLEFIMKRDIETLVTLINENPYLSIEELEHKINEAK